MDMSSFAIKILEVKNTYLAFAKLIKSTLGENKVAEIRIPLNEAMQKLI